MTLGDKNSGYFHDVTKGRRARNKLSMLETSEGLPLFDEQQIVTEIAKYFETIFISNGSDGAAIVAKALKPCISPTTNAALTSLPSVDDIKKALFAIHPDKAPGPDGFSACFFQSNWTAVGATIVTEIQSFFRSGIMPDSINTTHVRLIAKSQTAKVVSDFRPIALCNVYYKIISKLLSLRLRPVLGNIISESQYASYRDELSQIMSSSHMKFYII